MKVAKNLARDPGNRQVLAPVAPTIVSMLASQQHAAACAALCNVICGPGPARGDAVLAWAGSRDAGGTLGRREDKWIIDE